MRKKNGIATYAAAFILFAGAVGYLCYAGFSQNSVYFLTVSEARAVEPDRLRQARLFGLVADSSVDRANGEISFNLADKDNRANIIPVVYRGPAPDAFKEGAEVIVEGGLKEDGDFIAKILMTKCPSKYRKENRKD